MIRPEILSLWSQGVPAGHAFEENEIVERVPPIQGRLVVFDPRRPHGVSRVSGTLDPLEGRLVVHGWFAQPLPFVEGPMTPAAAEDSLQAFDKVLAKSLSNGIESTGTAAYRIFISPTGRATRVIKLASSLTCSRLETLASENRIIFAAVKTHFVGWKFPPAKRASILTLPLSFER